MCWNLHKTQRIEEDWWTYGNLGSVASGEGTKLPHTLHFTSHPSSYSWLLIVQPLSHVQLFATLWTAAGQASLSFNISWSLLKFMPIESMMLSNHLILCHALLFLPLVFPSIRVFCSEPSLCSRWPKYWSFSFSISPSNEYIMLISFRIDWFCLLAVLGTLKSLLQHHSSKASTFQCLAFFKVQLLYLYMTTEKS